LRFPALYLLLLLLPLLLLLLQLVVRGRFIQGGSANASGTDRPLYLRVTPTAAAGQVRAFKGGQGL
jgi:hypothetical protein